MKKLIIFLLIVMCAVGGYFLYTKYYKDKPNEKEESSILSSIDETKYKENKYYKEENLNEYISYDEVTNYDVETVITYVNIGINHEFYTNTKPTDISLGTLMIANKYNYLSSDFDGLNLVKMGSNYSTSGKYMNEEAYKYFKQMVDKAHDDGYSLKNISSYRSYSTQESIYNNYVKSDSKANADTYSARPGYSEHQTGLATDINTASSSDHFENTNTYKWLKENSYKFGFIERYPDGKTFITGYKFEPWHYRYVGIEAATIINQENITFEEYYVKYIIN